MPHIRLPVLAALAGIVLGQVTWAQGSDRQEIARLGCAACHADLGAAGLRSAPDLRATVPLMDAAFLEAFIASPHGVQPGTRMPHMLGALAADERARAAAELSAFLRQETEHEGPGATLERAASPERGERIFHDVGCVLCHGPRIPSPGGTRVPQGPDAAHGLDHVDAKYTTSGLAAFLLQPLRHRPSGLMPDMQLSRAEAADLAAYLAPPTLQPARPAAAPEASLAAAGAERFHALQCGSCHGGFESGATPRSAPARGNLLAGCLADEPPAGVPHYSFQPGERARLRDAIADLDAPQSPAELTHATLSAFRCTACHVRDGIGGVPARLDAYLATDEPDLGDHARRPPPLTDVGSKLQLSWMQRVLFDGASVRPYMHTRMPIFGVENVGFLPALLEDVDAEPALELPEPTGEGQKEARDAAHKMLGTTGLACVTCHTFNAKPAPSFQGLDLLTTPERLKERWFRDFLVSPQSKLPGIVMPEAWPGGVAAMDDLLDGDTDRQIAALWHFLKLGTSAPDPQGIFQPRWDVVVTDRPVVYRGRSRVAGFRGIAVGFPAGIHYAFDAQNGALAAIWRGDFVSVNWNGQGAGDFNPRSRASALARDVAWLGRSDEEAPWPLRPITTDEEPINPDPTYPRQHGYRFRGYRLDDSGAPTLRYALDGVAIEDRITAMQREERALLRREISLQTAAPVSISFRVLAGSITVLDDGRHECGGVIVAAPGSDLRLRAFEGGQELIIDLELARGRTSLELSYDLAD